MTGEGTNWMTRLRGGLQKTRIQLSTNAGLLGRDLRGYGRNADLLDDLEAALLAADVGGPATADILSSVQSSRRADLMAALSDALIEQLEPKKATEAEDTSGLTPWFQPTVQPSPVQPAGHVVMIIGVNGVGKTTTIAKLGQHYMEHGQSVMFAAGDTFRAAAGAQLEVWGDRLGVPVIQGREGGDPAAVALDGASSRRARGTDLLLVDTAGRLHNQTNLMQELNKVHRVIGKADAGEPAEVWMVLDAVTGQNGLQQAKKFNEAIPLTGVVVTKLDGTAKGGILIPIVRELGVPIKFIGVGEQAHDLQPFNAHEFVEALLAE
ncbi:signal recognition particle-docking protein FtsY [Deinococcus radiophilus]|uniref:signal recognition particle-docking protein FtsY n=1 Tax=Deinococcus radiophilus TaxID=32062 RepID=UPI001E2C8CBD|nr:signal recognition particle-docking protein FtsY [Deinococcus radiophilus]UFA50594.1 signal recognition particle-docking protein FtsY [Deinococcus radiophilus]